jgi:hypothetical protein
MGKKRVKTIKEVLDPKFSWAEYADSALQPPFIVNRFDDKQDNRFYYFKYQEEIIIAMGVTSAFNKVLIGRENIDRWKDKHPNWRQLLDVSSEYGTAEHILYGGIMLFNKVNEEVLAKMKNIAMANGQSQDMPIKDTLAFLKFQEEHQLTPLLIEAQIAWHDSDGNWLAMTIDLLAKMTITEKYAETVQDGVWQRGEKKGQPKMVEVKKTRTKEVILLVDFKSNFFEKEEKEFFEAHLMQLIAGARAVEQCFGIKVDGIYNYAPNAWRVRPSYIFYEHKVQDEDVSAFDAYWNLIRVKKLNIPKGQILLNGTFKNSDDFELVSYGEYAQRQLK